MDQKNSQRYKEVLQCSKYHLSKAEEGSISTLDHVTELKPFMDWFADFINSDHCLTQDELLMFEELEDEENVLSGEDLINALDEFFEEHSKDFDDVVDVSNFELVNEENAEIETAVEHLRTLRSFLASKLQNAKENASTLEVKDKVVSKELSEIVSCLLQLNNSINNMINTLHKTWEDLKAPLLQFDENDINGQFLSQQPLRKYTNEISRFENNLSHYFKFKFNDNAKSDVTVLQSVMNKASTPLNESVISSNQGKVFPQIKCKKLIRELTCVQEHIKINREEKTLALADEKAYSLALEQMNSLIENFSSGLKVSVPDVRIQGIDNSEKLAKEQEKLCELTESLSLNGEKRCSSESLKAVSNDQFIQLKRREAKRNNLTRLQNFIEQRLHCDEYLILFVEHELLQIDIMIKFMDDMVESASCEFERVQKNHGILVNQEDFLKKQAIQLCKTHPLISTLNTLYKLDPEDLNDISNLVHTIEVQNKIITDVSYQLAHLYNLGGTNEVDSMMYMRQLTNNIFSGKARQSVSNINKSMVPVKCVEKKIDNLRSQFKFQKIRFEEHIEYLTRNPHINLEKSLWSLFLVHPLEFKKLYIELEEKSKNRKTRTPARSSE